MSRAGPQLAWTIFCLSPQREQHAWTGSIPLQQSHHVKRANKESTQEPQEAPQAIRGPMRGWLWALMSYSDSCALFAHGESFWRPCVKLQNGVRIYFWIVLLQLWGFSPLNYVNKNSDSAHNVPGSVLNELCVLSLYSISWARRLRKLSEVKYLLAPISRIQAPLQSLWSQSLLFKLRFITLNFFIKNLCWGDFRATECTWSSENDFQESIFSSCHRFWELNSGHPADMARAFNLLSHPIRPRCINFENRIVTEKMN